MQWTIIKKKVSLGTRINKQTKANKHGFVLAYRNFFLLATSSILTQRNIIGPTRLIFSRAY